jgi:hypothetical protein
MSSVRPKSVDIKNLNLSPEEGFVLSRVDGPVSIKELVALTGLEEGRVVEIVGKLASNGAVDVDGMTPAAAAPAPQATGRVGPATQARSEPLEIPPIEEPFAEGEEQQEEQAAASSPEDDEELPPVVNESQPNIPATESSPELGQDEVAEEIKGFEDQERNYRRIYETTFKPLDRDERVKAAHTAEGSELFALCLDPDPQVIHGVLTNHKVGLEHARMIAFAHRTGSGLDILGRRTEFVSDAQVQRRLLGNPQLPDMLLKKIVNPKLLMDVYKICINREYPERTRVKVREHLIKKFSLATSEERAALLIKTEGRCLIQLTGVALDARAAQILQAKTTYTVLFIQNLARWSATPPMLLGHLLKQPVVRQNMGLRKMLLKHPNMPTELKRLF